MFEDHWTDTVAICQPPEPFIRHIGDNVLDDACRQAIIEDFGVDVGSFGDEVDILDDVLEGAFQLMGRSLPVDLAPTEDVHPEFVEAFQALRSELGVDDHRAVAYSLAASWIRSLTYREELPSLMRWRPSGAAWITGQSRHDGLTLGASLFHEGVHGYLYPNGHHVYCESFGEQGCDEGWRSAFGFHASLAGAWRPLLPVEDSWHYYWSDAALLLVRDGERVLETPTP